jgi:DNA replication and repair protein RecF
MMSPATICRELRLRDFRNFVELDLTLPPEGVALIGDNGEGKTNLVEALYYLEIFRSFRGAPDDQLVRRGADAFHIRGRFETAHAGSGADSARNSIEPAMDAGWKGIGRYQPADSVEHAPGGAGGGAAGHAGPDSSQGTPGSGRAGTLREIAVGYERRTHRKRVAVDGAEPDRIGDALGGIGAVVFSPSDLAIVTGAPGERRRFLDIVLSLNAPGYLAALQRYRQVLRQRNALLRDGAPPELLASWDEGLVDWGSRLIMARQSWVAARDAGFTRRYTAIAGGMAGRMIYQSAVPLPRQDGPAQIDEVADAFRAELARLARRERERGITLTGPHRDELTFVMGGKGGGSGSGPTAARYGGDDGGTRAGAGNASEIQGPWVDLRDFGSGGQQRTAAIALRMVEAETVREARGREPIILLDDIFAELDPGRSRRILELLEAEERGQVILTAPKASDLEVRRGSIPHWRLADGKVFS